MNSKVIGVILGIVIVGVGGAWVLYGNGQPAETGPITFGFIMPLTGDVASVGTIAKAAVEIAVEEINAGGGIDGRVVTVIYEDGQCKAEPSVSAANKLISIDKVRVILGGICSGETAAFAPTAMQNKVIVFANGSSAPDLSKTGKYFFRDYPSDAFQGKFAAEYIYNTLGARRVAVVYHISVWGTGIKDVFVQRFRELGGEIVFEEGAPQEARDYRTQLQKIKSANPDYIYTPTYVEGGIVLLKQVKELGITTKIFGADAWSDPKLQKEAAALDIVYSEAKMDIADDFKTKLSAKTSSADVPITVPQAYDAVYVLKAAIENAGGISDPDKLADAIRAIKYDGASGHIEFDQNGDITVANYVVKRIANGTATEVK